MNYIILKKTLLLSTLFAISVITFFAFYQISNAADPCGPKEANGGFALLECYPGIGKVQDAVNSGNSNLAFLAYVDFIVRYSIGILSIMAVIMIVYAGIKYLTVETFTGKSDSKKTIQLALGALVLLFSSFIFFNQLNPELLKIRFNPVSQSGDELVINSITDNFSAENFSDFDTLSRSGRFERAGYTESLCVGNQFLSSDGSDDEITACNTKISTHKIDNKDNNNENIYYYSECFLVKGLAADSVCSYYIRNIDKKNLDEDQNRFNEYYIAERDAESKEFTEIVYIEEPDDNSELVKNTCNKNIEDSLIKVYQNQCFCKKKSSNGLITEGCAFYTESYSKLFIEHQDRRLKLLSTGYKEINITSRNLPSFNNLKKGYCKNDAEYKEIFKDKTKEIYQNKCFLQNQKSASFYWK